MKYGIPMVIALRGYAEPIQMEQAKSGREAVRSIVKRKTLPNPSKWSVVFDTETKTDHTQGLRIGAYQVRDGDTLHERGLFFERSNLTRQEISVLRSYAAQHGLAVRSRDEFVTDVLYRYGYDRGGQIIGFNLPFDLSRLAIQISTSHHRQMRGGFSLKLRPEKWRPPILVKHLNSRSAFIRFSSSGNALEVRGMRRRGIKSAVKHGYFQDVKTLAAALLGRGHSLESLAKSLKTKHQKLGTDEHGGPLTPEYIAYSVNDVQVTWECYESLRGEYGKHGLTGTPPHRIYSEASLGKAYLRQMGIERWTKAQPDFPRDLLGIIMSSYYGGRAEVHIRRVPARVLYCDFRSMYPSICTLTGLWQFVISSGVDWTDCTNEIRGMLANVQTSDLQAPEFWKRLTVLVQIRPERDISPVRTAYSGNTRTIGLNYLTAEFPVWYTLADCIASTILTGKPPHVVQAIRFSPREPQSGLTSILLAGQRGFEIDPIASDFYKQIIELRGRAQTKAKEARRDRDIAGAERLESHAQMLKLLANSTSYGIFAELNVQSYDRPRDVMCHGADGAGFATSTASVEEPGTHFHPVIATLITGGARLMLALAERLAADKGLDWALCDTDSMALARPFSMNDFDFIDRSMAVTHWFDRLNPYADGKPLFKIEEQNFAADDPERHEELFALAISAKRYVLFNRGASGQPIIRKALAHGLGHLLPPYSGAQAPSKIPAPIFDLRDAGLERWQYDLWYRIVGAILAGEPDQVDLSDLPNMDQPAASRYAASTPALLHWFDPFNERLPLNRRVWAFNFMIAFHVSKARLHQAIASGDCDPEMLDEELPSAIAPFSDDPAEAMRNCFDRKSGRQIPAMLLSTYREELARYHLHSEAKFSNGSWSDRGVTKRKHVHAIAVEYIGKEANRWEEQFALGEMPDAHIEYDAPSHGQARMIRFVARVAERFGIQALADGARISRQALYDLLDGKAKPRPRTLTKLFSVIRQMMEEAEFPNGIAA